MIKRAWEQLKMAAQSVKSDWWLLGIAILVFVLILGFYFYKFYCGIYLQCLSNDADIWAKFGDYVGGILNPLLSAILLIAVIKELRHSSQTITDNKENIKKQNTFDVSQMFQSQGMMESRLAASKLLKARNRKIFDLRKIEKSNPDEYVYLANVLNAFRQLNVLKKTDLIDVELTKELFGSYYCHFRKYFKEIIEANGEIRSEKALLAQIQELDAWMPHDHSD